MLVLSAVLSCASVLVFSITAMNVTSVISERSTQISHGSQPQPLPPEIFTIAHPMSLSSGSFTFFDRFQHPGETEEAMTHFPYTIWGPHGMDMNTREKLFCKRFMDRTVAKEENTGERENSEKK